MLTPKVKTLQLLAVALMPRAEKLWQRVLAPMLRESQLVLKLFLPVIYRDLVLEH
jgi:hypothetical protein